MSPLEIPFCFVSFLMAREWLNLMRDHYFGGGPRMANLDCHFQIGASEPRDLPEFWAFSTTFGSPRWPIFVKHDSFEAPNPSSLGCRTQGPPLRFFSRSAPEPSCTGGRGAGPGWLQRGSPVPGPRKISGRAFTEQNRWLQEPKGLPRNLRQRVLASIYLKPLCLGCC